MTDHTTIVHVVKQFDEDLGRDVYCIALRDAAGEVLTPRLRGDELRVFATFQTVLQERFGVTFDDRGQFTGRRGQDRWETHLDELLNGDELPR